MCLYFSDSFLLLIPDIANWNWSWRAWGLEAGPDPGLEDGGMVRLVRPDPAVI